MKKYIKLTLLGTLLTSSALAITLPIVSCSASADVAVAIDVTATVDAPNASTTMKTYLGTVDLVTQQGTLKLGNIITTGVLFTDLVAAVSFVETGTTTPAPKDIISNFEVTTGATFEAGAPISNVILTVNLKEGYSSSKAITIDLTSLGNAAAKVA